MLLSLRLRQQRNPIARFRLGLVKPFGHQAIADLFFWHVGGIRGSTRPIAFLSMSLITVRGIQDGYLSRPFEGTDDQTLHIWTRKPPFLGDNPPWQSSHFTGTLNISRKKPGGTFRLRLKNQTLYSPSGESITVSGTVVAKRVSYEIIEQKIKNREEEIQKFSL